MKVKFKRFSSRARVPQKATIGSACYDLFAATCVTLEPGATRSVETDPGFFSRKSTWQGSTPGLAFSYSLYLLAVE